MPANYFAPSDGEFKIIIPTTDCGSLGSSALTIPIDMNEYQNYRLRYNFQCTHTSFGFFRLEFMSGATPQNFSGRYGLITSTGFGTPITYPLGTAHNVIIMGGVNIPYTLPSWGEMEIKTRLFSVSNVVPVVLKHTLANPSNPTEVYQTYAMFNVYFSLFDSIRITPITYQWANVSDYSLVAWDAK